MDELVAEARAGGLSVDLRREGTPIGLPPEVDRAALRIVQEALTNVRRHAPASARVSIRIGYDPTELTVQVDNTGDGAARSTVLRSTSEDELMASGEDGSTGTGIAGMRERVAALGGEMLADARGDGGFRVLARLPISTAARSAP